MKRIFFSKSAFFNPRIFAAFVLVTFGVSLGVFSFAGPRPASKTAASSIKPVVRMSISNGTSRTLRSLVPAQVTEREEHETELRRVRPNVPVPDNFIDSVVQTSLGVATIPTPLLTFEGMNQAEGCGGCIPPDTNGAVGPNQYVQMVNSAVSVYDKTGTRQMGPTPINELWANLPGACKDNNNGDPVVVYDQLADRWMLSQFAVPGGAVGYHECIAVSKGPDATGEYYVYDFLLSTTKFEDYPHFGLWPDGYYMATHEFNTAGTAYLGAGVWAFERDKLLTGQPAQMVYFSMGNGNTAFGGQLPSTLDGYTLPPAGAPNYFTQVDTATDIPPTAALRVWKFHVDWTTPANSTFGINTQPDSVVPVANFARPSCSLAGNRAYVVGCVPQAGDPSQLDPIGDRLMYRAAYRNFGDHEALVVTNTVVANSTTGQMGPRWYEVRDPGGSPQIFQESTFGPIDMTDLLYRFVPSIAMDRAGDLAIGYSTSSSASFPAIAYAGRLANDPLNSLAQGEAIMHAGTGPMHGELFAPQTGRWGDYSDMTVDPVDDCTFWYTTEYFDATDAPTGAWHTRVGSFKFSECTPRPVGTLRGTVTDSATGNPLVHVSITAGGYTAFTNEEGYYQFSPLAPGTYTDTASQMGYFSSSVNNVVVTDAGVTTQDFALVRNTAEPTPTPAPPTVLKNVNPPVLNDPGTTVTTNSFPLTWSPAEVTAGLASYIVEESTDYVVTLFDNADGTAMPGDAASPWASVDNGAFPGAWVKNTEYFHSPTMSYFTTGPTDGFDISLTLKNAVTIPGTIGSARLNFWSRFYNDPEDTGNIEISKNGGTSWTSLGVLMDGPTAPPADLRMQNQEIDLTAYKGMPIKLRFRFNTDPVTYFLVHTVGWWVDDINVDAATWTQIGTAGPTATSFNVINKAAGHYYYRVRGTYGNGRFTTNSNVQDMIVNPPAQFLSAQSRKAHGGAGTFNVDLPLIGNAGIEPRSGGAGGNYIIAYNFQNPITNCGSISGASGIVAVGTDGKSCVANVSGLPNAQYSTITLQGVTDGSGTFNVSASVGVLIGDTNGDGFVDSADIAQTKSQSGQAVTNSNFREDINVDGFLDSADIAFVKSKSGTALP